MNKNAIVVTHSRHYLFRVSNGISRVRRTNACAYRRFARKVSCTCQTFETRPGQSEILRIIRRSRQGQKSHPSDERASLAYLGKSSALQTKSTPNARTDGDPNTTIRIPITGFERFRSSRRKMRVPVFYRFKNIIKNIKETTFV